MVKVDKLLEVIGAKMYIFEKNYWSHDSLPISHYPLLVKCWQHATSLRHVGHIPKKKGFHMWIMFIKWQFIMIVTYKCELTISRTIVENSDGLATSRLAPIVEPLIILTSNLTTFVLIVEYLIPWFSFRIWTMIFTTRC